jgi:hypothetical protein
MIYSINGTIKDKTLEALNRFFHDVSIEDISTEKNQAWFSLAFNKLGRIDNERARKLGRAIVRLLKYPSIQILSSRGYTKNQLDDFYNIPSIRCSQKTKLHEIFGIPKYAINFINECYKQTEIIGARAHFYINSSFIRSIYLLDETFGGNNTKELLKLYKENSSIKSLDDGRDIMIDLHKEYNYENILKLGEYLTRQVKFQQGITSPHTAITLLRDYVRMATCMGLPVEKYPKSLKKNHDIALMNYRTFEDKVKESYFKKVTDDDNYKNLLYKNKNYAVVIPETVQDVIKEGESLSHCVASYVDDIISRKCKIMFIREANNKKLSLLTVEIRNNSIRQAKGKNNRSANDEERQFIKEWTEKKKIENYI